MKTQHLFLSFITLLFVSFSASAQKKGAATANVKVWGNCGMCKKTIETAAKNAGATEATWSPETKILAVSWNAKNNSSEKIQKAVAAAGYDTQDFTAPEEVYEKLHFCCQYDRKETTAATTTSAVSTEKADCCDSKECKHENSNCCKDGKCEKAGHAKHDGKEAKDCCKDNAACKDKGCCKKA